MTTQPNGILCPLCGSHQSKVLETRARPSVADGLLRKRQCWPNHHIFTTVEQVVMAAPAAPFSPSAAAEPPKPRKRRRKRDAQA